jgi:hypothetical protein
MRGYRATSCSRTRTASRRARSRSMRPRPRSGRGSRRWAPRRGGAYTYDWIENLIGLDMHSADSVLPEYQHPQVGDTFGYGKNRMRFERVEPQRVLATRSEDSNWVWTFVLDERDGRTRLISRNRFRLPTLTAKVGMVPMEPASLVMERKMLREIKRRAERLADEEKEDRCLRPARVLRRTRLA